MFGKQPKTKEVSRLSKAVHAGKVAGKITLAAANGLLPASAPAPMLTAHSTFDAVPVEVSQPQVGEAVIQVRNADGTPGPVTEISGELPPPSEAVVTVPGTPNEAQYAEQRSNAE